MPVKKYVCGTYPEEHIFDESTEDGFCPLDPPFHGILIPTNINTNVLSIVVTHPENRQEFDEGNNITISVDTSSGDSKISKVEFFADDVKLGEDVNSPFSYTYFKVTRGDHIITAKIWDSNGISKESKPVKIKVRKGADEIVPEVGLCILLMDASVSMEETAYKGNPLSKMRIVATTAASGIFELERMINNPYAFVAAFKFDDRVEHMFTDTVANLIYRYDKNVTKFANYIYDELYKFRQGTDINQALKQAHAYVDKFMKGQLPNFPLKKYKVVKQRTLKIDSTESVSIANVRVLIYTDGVQFDARGNKRLEPNPFATNPIEGLNHDVLIGAFFGNETDEGCEELKGLLSRCPLHDELQFFLFDKPGEIGTLKSLFRMASGTSGFCRTCLDKR